MIKKLKAKNRIYLIAAILLVGVFSGCSNKSIETNKEVSTQQKKLAVSQYNARSKQRRGLIVKRALYF